MSGKYAFLQVIAFQMGPSASNWWGKMADSCWQLINCCRRAQEVALCHREEVIYDLVWSSPSASSHKGSRSRLDEDSGGWFPWGNLPLDAPADLRNRRLLLEF